MTRGGEPTEVGVVSVEKVTLDSSENAQLIAADQPVAAAAQQATDALAAATPADRAASVVVVDCEQPSGSGLGPTTRTAHPTLLGEDALAVLDGQVVQADQTPGSVLGHTETVRREAAGRGRAAATGKAVAALPRKRVTDHRGTVTVAGVA